MGGGLEPIIEKKTGIPSNEHGNRICFLSAFLSTEHARFLPCRGENRFNYVIRHASLPTETKPPGPTITCTLLGVWPDKMIHSRISSQIEWTNRSWPGHKGKKVKSDLFSVQKAFLHKNIILFPLKDIGWRMNGESELKLSLRVATACWIIMPHYFNYDVKYQFRNVLTICVITNWR